MTFLQSLDLFKRNPTLMIKKSDSVSVTETICISFIFYLVSASIIIYNFLDAYLENKPIVQEFEKIRNLTSYEIIDTSKLKLGITTNNVNVNERGVLMEVLQIKDPRILGMPLINMNTNTKAKYFPSFEIQQDINSVPSTTCPYFKNHSNLLSANIICTEYFEQNTTIGGNVFSGIETFQQIIEMKIDFCDFYNIIDQTYDPRSIEKFIKNDPSQIEYHKYLENPSPNEVPNGYPLTQIMYMRNSTNMNKLYAGLRTNFQLEDPEYLSCNRNFKKYLYNVN